jgi:hypothetical protein
MPNKRFSLLLLLLGLGLVLGGRVAWAHHSALAEFDPSKPVKVTGTLQSVVWANPHVWFFVDVTEADGTVTTWGFSTSPPGSLMRRGITKDVMRLGAVVNVEGARARDGSNHSSTRSLTFEDGTAVLAPPEERQEGQ